MGRAWMVRTQSQFQTDDCHQLFWKDEIIIPNIFVIIETLEFAFRKMEIEYGKAKDLVHKLFKCESLHFPFISI
jgi:hypothetical protein